MRKISVIIVGILVVIGYIVADKPGSTTAGVTAGDSSIEQNITEGSAVLHKKEPLIIVGQGGNVGYLFLKAADTYAKEHGGYIAQVDSGDEFIDAIHLYIKERGAIQDFVYFGHGNAVGLYVNQSPSINGAVYANDPLLNTSFSAASIYELPRDIFEEDATAVFYGCNVAHEDGNTDSFAELFANHFDVTVRASSGPTEFSLNPESAQTPPKNPDDSALYMVPTTARGGFVTLKPRAAGVAGFADVHVQTIPAEAILEMQTIGLNIAQGTSFTPYKTITYEEAQSFCTIINPDACDIGNADPQDQIRNVAALKMLLDATGIPIKQSNTLHEGEIYYARNNNLLTHDFTKKRWYTRGEMAILTRNILHHSQLIQAQ